MIEKKEYYNPQRSTINCSRYIRERIYRIARELPAPYLRRVGGKSRQIDVVDLGLQLLEEKLGIEHEFDPIITATYALVELHKVFEDE